MVKAEIEMLKKSLFSLKLFWEQDDECLHTGTKLKKITKKVEFNIASEASYVYILTKKLPKIKIVHFGDFLKS